MNKIVILFALALISFKLIPNEIIPSTEKIQVKKLNLKKHIVFNTVTNASISWKAWHFGKTHERYGKVPISKAEIYIKRKKLKGGIVEFSIENLTVENFGERKEKEYLTNHLKSADFFETDSFPTAYFEISKVKKSKGEYSHLISGNLQIKNISRNITLPCNYNYYKDSVQLSFKPFEINRNDWKLTYHNSETSGISSDYLIDNGIGFEIDFWIKRK
ncbi:MAG: YceI family protein [Flavobacteriales bacterium]